MDYYDFATHPGQYSGLIPVAADTVISSGGLVARDASGNAIDADSDVVGSVVGRSDGGADNTGGSAGDVNVLVERGCYALKLDASDPPTKAHIGKTVFATAPDTVAHTGTCAAGRLVGFDAAGLPIVDTALQGFQTTAALTSTDGTAAAASANLAGLAAEAEKIGDDVRAIHAALVTAGIITAG